MLNFDIRYGKLPAREIYNSVGPWDWQDSEERKAKRQSYIVRVQKDKPNFYKELEESILKEGIRNPILAVTGRIMGWQWEALPEFARDRVWCNQWGGSRLFVAQKHDLTVPVLISDFDKKYTDFELITNGNRIRELFDMELRSILFTKRGMVIKI